MTDEAMLCFARLVLYAFAPARSANVPRFFSLSQCTDAGLPHPRASLLMPCPSTARIIAVNSKAGEE